MSDRCQRLAHANSQARGTTARGDLPLPLSTLVSAIPMITAQCEHGESRPVWAGCLQQSRRISENRRCVSEPPGITTTRVTLAGWRRPRVLSLGLRNARCQTTRRPLFSERKPPRLTTRWVSLLCHTKPRDDLNVTSRRPIAATDPCMQPVQPEAANLGSRYSAHIPATHTVSPLPRPTHAHRSLSLVSPDGLSCTRVEIPIGERCARLRCPAWHRSWRASPRLRRRSSDGRR